MLLNESIVSFLCWLTWEVGMIGRGLVEQGTWTQRLYCSTCMLSNNCWIVSWVARWHYDCISTSDFTFIQIYSQLQQLCEIVYVKRLGYKDCIFGVIMHCSTWLQHKWSSKHNFWLFCSLKEQLWITMWFKLHYVWYAYYYFMKLSPFLILI